MSGYDDKASRESVTMGTIETYLCTILIPTSEVARQGKVVMIRAHHRSIHQ